MQDGCRSWDLCSSGKRQLPGTHKSRSVLRPLNHKRTDAARYRSREHNSPRPRRTEDVLACTRIRLPDTAGSACSRYPHNRDCWECTSRHRVFVRLGSSPDTIHSYRSGLFHRNRKSRRSHHPRRPCRSRKVCTQTPCACAFSPSCASYRLQQVVFLARKSARGRWRRAQQSTMCDGAGMR